MPSAEEKQRRKAMARKAREGYTRFRTKQDIPVFVMTQWAAPYTGGYDRVLRAGEVFSVQNPISRDATMVYAEAENYKGLHAELVPLSDRIRFWSYSGYVLCLRIKDLDAHCERLPDEKA